MFHLNIYANALWDFGTEKVELTSKNVDPKVGRWASDLTKASFASDELIPLSSEAYALETS